MAKNGVTVKFCERNKEIFYTGDRIRFIYLILSGKMLIGRILYDGSLWASILKEGFFLGEYLDTDELFTATPAEDCYLLAIPKRLVVNKLLKIQGFQYAILESDCKKRKIEAETLDWLCSNHSTYRVSRALLVLSEYIFDDYQNGGLVDIPISHDNLSAITGLTRETITRTINDFKQAGIVMETGRNRKIRFDIKKLSNFILEPQTRTNMAQLVNVRG